MTSLTQSLKVVYLTMLSKNPGTPITSLMSMKIMFVMASLTGLTIISLYKAMLGASLAVKIESKPYNSIKDIADSGKKVILIDQSYIHDLVLNSTKSFRPQVRTNFYSTSLLISDYMKLDVKYYDHFTGFKI